jgi:hypothetical protein
MMPISYKYTACRGSSRALHKSVRQLVRSVRGFLSSTSTFYGLNKFIVRFTRLCTCLQMCGDKRHDDGGVTLAQLGYIVSDDAHYSIPFKAIVRWTPIK